MWFSHFPTIKQTRNDKQVPVTTEPGEMNLTLWVRAVVYLQLWPEGANASAPCGGTPLGSTSPPHISLW